MDLALEAINEAEAMAERFEIRYWCAELPRLRGVFLAVMGAEGRAIRDRSNIAGLEGGEASAAVAAYIELNPVRAGLCPDPKDYRYCGYAEALAKGSSLASQGIRIVLGQSDAIS